jgi:hypothetical protein
MAISLTRGKIAEILTESCPAWATATGQSRHVFLLADEWDELVVKCGRCQLTINFNDYTYSQKESPRPQERAPAIGPAPQPKVEDKPPAEWLEPKFHDADCFRLPKHSGFIDESLFWYMVEYIRDSRIPQSSLEPDSDSVECSLLPQLADREKDPPFYIQATSEQSGIRRIYVNRAYTPRCRSLESYCGNLMEEAARFNLQKLVGCKFKPEFEAKALEEIEHQLVFVSPETVKARHPRAIFAHLKNWREKREERLQKPARSKHTAQAV